MKNSTISATWLFSNVMIGIFALSFCFSTSAGTPPKPQIPKRDFEWKGSFIGNAADLSAPQVEYDLTVRGKWQGEYFDLYMLQGGENSDTWVENLIYQNRLYTITHKWHTDIPDFIKGKCFQNMVYNAEQPWKPLPITVDDFNRGLEKSRFVGREKIGGKRRNHFRHTCITQAAPQFFPFAPPADPDDPNSPGTIPFKVFSDIYVPVGKSYPWKGWLQYGDGVGPDPQEDEWFLSNKSNNRPDAIILPEQCQIWNSFTTLFYVQQTTCKNLVEKK